MVPAENFRVNKSQFQWRQKSWQSQHAKHSSVEFHDIVRKACKVSGCGAAHEWQLREEQVSLTAKLRLPQSAVYSHLPSHRTKWKMTSVNAEKTIFPKSFSIRFLFLLYLVDNCLKLRQVRCIPPALQLTKIEALKKQEAVKKNPRVKTVCSG